MILNKKFSKMLYPFNCPTSGLIHRRLTKMSSKTGLKNSECMGFLFIISTRKRRKNTGPQKYREGASLSVLVLPLLEQSSKTMPANTTPKSDRHAFQLLTTQSVLSVHKKARDSCWLLHSAVSVMLAHSPRPCTHTEKERETWEAWSCSLLQRRSGPRRPCCVSGHIQAQLWGHLHICNIFINNNPKINERIMNSLKEKEAMLMITVKGDSVECFRCLATTKFKDSGIWLVFLFSHFPPA